MKKVMFTAFAVGLGLTANLMAQVPSYVPTNGLVGWWPFNGNANDESGNGNNGTVNGATLTTDRFGNANKAFDFDGIDDKITVADISTIENQTDLTISVWFQYHSIPNGSAGRIISKEISGVNSNRIMLGIDSYFPPYNDIRFVLNSNSDHFIQSNIGFQSNNYYHLVAVFQSNPQLGLNKMRFYINGALISSTLTGTFPVVTPTNAAPLRFGAHDTNGSCFDGVIDDIGIWNRSLSECEIHDLYNSQINSVAGSISVSPNTASIGSNVMLSTASNSTNIQWQTNGVNLGWQNVPFNSIYSGGTTNTLTVNNVQLANHNQPFRAIASSGNCTDTSNIATIQIADTCITNVSVFDTTFITVYDTTYITVQDTLLTTVTDTLIINTTLSLPAPNNENTILIYPNPASDHITIDNGNFAAMAGYSIKIENNAGQQVFQSLINQAQFYVDLSTWTGNGLYFVHLIDAQNNTVMVRKIVLQ